jgi:hypothetical protein
MKKIEIKKKIQALLASNDDANFELALILARQHNISDLGDELYPYLIKWLEYDTWPYNSRLPIQRSIQQIKQYIQQLKQSEELHISRESAPADLTTFIPEFFKLLPNLNSISYSNYSSQPPTQLQIPTYFQTIPKLKKLLVHNMKGISPEIALLTNLTEISLQSVPIIPDEIYQLPNLKKLRIYDEQINISDKVIHALALEELDLPPHSSKIFLSPKISQLKALKSIYLDGRDEQTGYVYNVEIRNIKGFNHKFVYVDELFLSGFNPESATHFLRLFPNLKTLYLKYMTFESFPYSVKEMKKLEALHLVGVNEDCIPQWVRKSPILKTLEIDDSWKKYQA